MISISKIFLYLPYIPAFFLLFLVIADIFLFKGAVHTVLPSNQEETFLYYIFFGLPHILASFFMFVEKEYRDGASFISHKKVALFVALGGTVFFLNQFLFYVLYVGYTLYHVVNQQIGIAKFFGLIKESLFLRVLSYVFIFVGSFGYITSVTTVREDALLFITLTGVTSAASFLLFGGELRQNKYLLLFVLSFLCSAILFGLGYGILGLVSMRIVHDITAFIFYSVHNANRKNDGNNILFCSPIVKKVSPLVLTPLYALLLNALYVIVVIKSNGLPLLTTFLLFLYYTLSITHYFIEGRIWKKGTPARNYIHVV